MRSNGAISWLVFLLGCTVVVPSSSSLASSSSSSASSHRRLQKANDETDSPNTDATEDTASSGSDVVVRTDLVRLIPFDVQIALTFQDEEELSAINVVALTDIITDWMSASFETKYALTLEESSPNNSINNNNNNSSSATAAMISFDSIGLELVTQRVQTSEISNTEQIALLTTSYEGVSLWERMGSNTPPMDPELVELMQRATFLEDNALLIMLRQGADTTAMPQNSIVDVRAFITPPSSSGGNGSDQSSSANGSVDNKNLEIIIIIAIVVACLAFGLLIFAVVWAWRSDRQGGTAEAPQKQTRNQQKASKVQPPPKSAKKGIKEQKISNHNDGTGSESEYGAMEAGTNKPATTNTAIAAGATTAAAAAATAPAERKTNNPFVPQEVPFNNDSDRSSAPSPLPDSIVSEDVTTSLTAYYKSGMPPYHSSNSRGMMNHHNHELNDAASMSSMDSYGYSLDGYAPSLGPAPQGGYPVGPLQAARGASITVGDEDEGSNANYNYDVDDDYDASIAGNAKKDAALGEVEDYGADA
jgi:hypothetical protein